MKKLTYKWYFYIGWYIYYLLGVSIIVSLVGQLSIFEIIRAILQPEYTNIESHDLMIGLIIFAPVIMVYILYSILNHIYSFSSGRILIQQAKDMSIGLSICFGIAIAIIEVIASIKSLLTHHRYWYMILGSNSMIAYFVLPFFAIVSKEIKNVQRKHNSMDNYKYYLPIIYFFLIFLIPSVLVSALTLGIWLIHYGGILMCIGCGILVGLLFSILYGLGLLNKKIIHPK